MVDSFDVQHDRVGLHIDRKVVEHIAESHVRRGAERRDRRKADLALCRPIDDARAYSARLREQRQPARQRGRWAEEGLHAGVRTGEAEAVRADQAYAAAAVQLDQQLLSSNPVGTLLPEAGGQDERIRYADGSAVLWTRSWRRLTTCRSPVKPEVLNSCSNT